ncbi:hypothetical protein [Pseudoalteromonas phenolica]|uniref:hypothetical protein n=1 Tax=Pseudoalteromonas phenolica TaxID=161398 RepID=UPI00384E8B2D
MSCKLCGSLEPLQESHIIPRSYYRKLKNGDGQLIAVTCDEFSQPKKMNSDPKEKLLCLSCERHLDENFEKYGTRLFQDYKNVKKTRNYIEFNGFKYEEYYLFLVSILWRASVSTLSEFSRVILTDKINKWLANCIERKTLRLDGSIKLDDILNICILRIVDTKTGIDDDTIKGVLLNIGVDTENNGLVFYFMISGFLIAYNFDLSPHIRKPKLTGQLIKRSKLKVPKAELTELTEIKNAFFHAINQAQNYAL